MSDEERLELQMVSRYQDRLTEARRMKMWEDCERIREERAREALRLHPHWPDTNERQRPRLIDALEVVGVVIGFSMIGGTLAWGLWKLFN